MAIGPPQDLQWLCRSTSEPLVAIGPPVDLQWL